jgi:hypothetical protein
MTSTDKATQNCTFFMCSVPYMNINMNRKALRLGCWHYKEVACFANSTIG